MDSIILQLFDIGAIKFGSFTLKSGMLSPIYIDLRESISYPRLLQDIAEAMWQQISKKHFDRICGVPYTALPIASYLSIKYNCPMVMRRKEAKGHGTGKLIEGIYAHNHKCLVVEDLITSGASIFETIAPLESVGIKVEDVVVFLDRQQGGKEKVEQKGYNLHSVFSIGWVLDILLEHGKIDQEAKSTILTFIRGGP